MTFQASVVCSLIFVIIGPMTKLPGIEIFVDLGITLFLTNMIILANPWLGK